MQGLDGDKLAYSMGIPAAAGQFLAGQSKHLMARLDSLEHRVAELEALKRVPAHLRNAEHRQATPAP